LHAARWEKAGEPGVFADPRVRAFHRASATGLINQRLLRLAVLRIGGAIAACCHALLGPECMYLYLSGFDPAFAFESPGTILLGRLIEMAIAEGRREIHFLRGGESYKLAWSSFTQRNAMRSFSPP
jgi:CelD/BcsL family acetyltransferase involved in cellulose biosynthesis